MEKSTFDRLRLYLFVYTVDLLMHVTLTNLVVVYSCQSEVVLSLTSSSSSPFVEEFFVLPEHIFEFRSVRV